MIIVAILALTVFGTAAVVFCTGAGFDWIKREIGLYRKRHAKTWREPWTCRRLGHQWEKTDHIIQSSFMPATLSICARCRCGCSRGFMDWDFFTPETISKYLTQVQAESAGKVTSITGKAKND